MNNCQAGHVKHSHIEVMTDLGPMVVYDWQKYMGFNGFCTGQDDVSMTLFQIGTWDQPIKDLIERLLYGVYDNGVFVDVGSHVGYFSKLAQKYLFKDIYAYEAESESVEISKQNVPSAKVHQIWFDENTKKKTFDTNFKVDIMKIDIEGSEQHAIRYFWQLIENQQVEHIIMEVSPVFNSSYPELLKRIKECRYETYELTGEKFNWNFDFPQKNLWMKKI